MKRLPTVRHLTLRASEPREGVPYDAVLLLGGFGINARHGDAKRLERLTVMQADKETTHAEHPPPGHRHV